MKMIIVIVEISTEHSEEFMLLFSLNNLFILIQKMETSKTYKEELNLASYEINIINYMLPITIYIYIYMKLKLSVYINI